MRQPKLESAGAALAPQAKTFEEWRDRPRQGGGREGFVQVLPDLRDLANWLGFEASPAVHAVLKQALLEPVGELLANPGKRIRGQLVALSFRLLNGDTPYSVAAAKKCRGCAEAVELIHAGSLIVDDIEDGSTARRGRPALHVSHSLPIALNAGNWLYFWPFQLIKEMGLSEDELFFVYEACQRTLLRAHFGQALDLGTKVDGLEQKNVAEVCLASMRLKTGALMGLATVLGGVIANASRDALSVLDDFGRDLGVALQMFDDLGNVIGKCEPLKRYEDLLLCRPSWVWACAAESSSAAVYREFVAAAQKLPDAEELQHWLERQGLVAKTRTSARAHLDRCFDALKAGLDRHNLRWSSRAFEELRALGEEIAVVYG